MRNLFDQYSQPENKITHALMSVLDKDRHLLKEFIRWVDPNAPPITRLSITEQQVPGVPVAQEENESRGLPDGCIYSNIGDISYALLIESKVQSRESEEQLLRHKKTAERYGFSNIKLLLITVDDVTKRIPDSHLSKIETRTWTQIYEKMGDWSKTKKKHALSVDWASEFRKYLEIFESKADSYEIRGTLTMFDGIHFNKNQPYTYHEAKRLLRLIGDNLQNDSRLNPLNLNKDSQRRSSITGKDDNSVWDFIPIAEMTESNNFTDKPHLTLNIDQDKSSIAITVPNGCKGIKNKLKELGPTGFFEILSSTEILLSKINRKYNCGRPFVYIIQRHYKSQRSPGIEDAAMSFDLRVLKQDNDSKVVHQPLWGTAIHQLLIKKKGNLQMGLSFEIPHSTPIAQSSKLLDVYVEAALAMKNFLYAFR